MIVVDLIYKKKKCCSAKKYKCEHDYTVFERNEYVYIEDKLTEIHEKKVCKNCYKVILETRHIWQ